MSKKILIVDDDPEIRELLAFTLKRAGYHVGTAGDGIEAVKKTRSLLPDLVLLDLMLPELDGLSVCELMRDDPDLSSVRVIMLTAHSTQFARASGFESGADDFITKPFSPTLLVLRIKALLAEPPRSLTRQPL